MARTYRLASFRLMLLKERSLQNRVLPKDAKILGFNGHGSEITVGVAYRADTRFLDPENAPVDPNDTAYKIRRFVVRFDGDLIGDEDVYMGSAPLQNGRSCHIFEVID